MLLSYTQTVSELLKESLKFSSSQKLCILKIIYFSTNCFKALRYEIVIPLLMFWKIYLPLNCLLIKLTVMEDANTFISFLTTFKVLSVFPCIRLKLMAHILSPMQTLPILSAGLPGTMSAISTKPSDRLKRKVKPYSWYFSLRKVTSRTIPNVLKWE